MSQIQPAGETSRREVAESTTATDIAVPDDQEPRIPGDSGILLGSEAATIDRNQCLTSDADGEPDTEPLAPQRINRCTGRSRKRGSLRRR